MNIKVPNLPITFGDLIGRESALSVGGRGF